jgi:hypothetical protein
MLTAITVYQDPTPAPGIKIGCFLQFSDVALKAGLAELLKRTHQQSPYQ